MGADDGAHIREVLFGAVDPDWLGTEAGPDLQVAASITDGDLPNVAPGEEGILLRHSRLSGRWVATYFVAALRRSAIGLLGAFGQKPDQIS